MKYLAFALLLVGTTLTRCEANAQDFYYTPPGYGYGYYSGLNFGNGVGYGYGLGVGIALPPQAFMSSYTPAQVPMQYFGSDFEAQYAASTGNTFPAPRPVVRPTKKKVAKKPHQVYYPGIGPVAD